MLPRRSCVRPRCSCKPPLAGPVKPMASNTRSASSANSVPGMTVKSGVIRVAWSWVTLPAASPVKRMVLTLQSRRPPSSCELSMAGAEAVRAGVAAADDHYALAGGQNGFRFGDSCAFVAAVLLGEELHGEVDALEVAARDG